MGRITLILLVVCFLVFGPMLTTTLPGVWTDADVAFACEEPLQEDGMDFWDWFVLWCTWYYDQWPP